jgi:hypothetical protein
MNVRQMLSHKYLLSLEGWGMASGLKWMLYSNSVVFMAPPTKVSWAMEDLLIPYVHYIPLKADHSDLPQQLEWARSNQEKCQTINLQARAYMEDLVTCSQRDTVLILREMGQRYERNYGVALQACNVTESSNIGLN